MTIEVRYYSKTGNTKKLAEVIAKQVGVTAKSITERIEGDFDILFIGGAVYAFDIDPLLKTFIESLDPQKIKTVVIFSTAAIVKSAYKQIKGALKKRGLHVSSKEFHCPGHYKILRKGRPNIEDIKNAERFAQEVLKTER